MARGYILLTVAASAAPDVLTQIRDVDEVKRADIVEGTFDIVAEIEAKSGDILLVVVTEQIRPLSGVGRVHTCLVSE